MRANIPLLTLVGAALLWTMPATAQDKTDQPPNRSERRQRMIEQFDADGDGSLNDEERAKARAERGNRGNRANTEDREREAQAERDGDRPGPMRLFDRFDENKDGQLSREEFMKLSDSMRELRERRGQGPPPEGRRARPDERRGPPSERGDRPRGPRREDGDRFRPLQNPGPPPRRDEERRGFRGGDEERGARDRRGFENRGPERMGPPNPERLFNAFDANKDDQLSREEFMQLTEAMRERMQRAMGQRFRDGPPEGRRPDRPRRPERPRRPPPPEFENAPSAEPAADDNSA